MDLEMGFNLILAELQELKQGQTEMKSEMSLMKEDISELRQGQAEMKEDISELKQGQTEMRQDILVMQGDISDLKDNTEQIKENTRFICALVNGQAVIETKVDDFREETNRKFAFLFKRVDDIERIVMRNTYDIALLKEAR